MVKIISVIVILLVVGLVAFSATTIIGDITPNYDINASTAFIGTYDQINQTQETTKDMEAEISGEGGSLSTGYSILKGTGYILQMILGSLSTIKTMIYEAMGAFGLPDEFGLALVGIIVAVIVIAILNFVLGRENR